MLSNIYIDKITNLKKEYEELRIGKSSLLKIIDEAEIPDSVYNSNAIENSTLSLIETEKILLEIEVSRDISIREVFEAKNLARVSEYIRHKDNFELSIDNILLLHKMLLGGINDSYAGRMREKDENVRVGLHIAPQPIKLNFLMNKLMTDYRSSDDKYFLSNISYFHLEFERIHPFNDGNGRMGRLLINLQLISNGYPPIIIRNKIKNKDYYPIFNDFISSKKTGSFDKLLALLLIESLHKRLAYLKGLEIVTLTEYAKTADKSIQTLLNSARRQTIPAFREKSVWKIGI